MQKIHSHLYPKGVNKENKPGQHELRKMVIPYEENAGDNREAPGKVGVQALAQQSKNRIIEPQKRDEEEEDDDYENDPWD